MANRMAPWKSGGKAQQSAVKHGAHGVQGKGKGPLSKGKGKGGAAVAKGKGSKGNAKGSAKGSWVWLGSQQATTKRDVVVKGKGKVAQGKGFQGKGVKGKGAKGKGAKGKGKVSQGKGVQGKGAKDNNSKIKEKLKGIDSSLKVWVGGLAETTTWKQLQEHFSVVAKPHVTDIMRSGKAVVAYKTTEDVENAITTLNGSDLEGNTLEVDYWVKPEGEARERKPRKEKKRTEMKVVKHTLKVKGLKKGLKGKTPLSPMEEKIREKLKTIDHSLKIWVGGLKPEVTWKQVSKHFSEVAKPKVTSLMNKKGAACIAFETVDAVQTAIDTLNGSEINGQTIEVDAWTKPERRERKQKEMA